MSQYLKSLTLANGSVKAVTFEGNLSPTSVAATGTVTGSNLSGTNTGDQTNISGNAATVTTNANLTGPVTSVGNATAIAAGVVTEAMQVLADNTTQNVSTSKHGYAPKAPNDATKYLDGTGAYSTPAGGGAGDGTTFTAPVFGNWTGVMKNSATFNSVGNSAVIYAPATSNDEWSIATTPVPGAVPYSCIFHLRPVYWVTNYMSYGVFWRDSATNKFKSIGLVTNTAIQTHPLIEVGLASDGTASIDSDYFLSATGVITAEWRWFKLTDDNTNQTFSISPDGANWFQCFSHARNTDVTPNQVGFFFNVRNSISLDGLVALWSYTGI